MEIKLNNEVCEKYFGGVEACFLFPFENYKKRQLIYDYNYLTTFPETTIYPVKFVGNLGYTDVSEETKNGNNFNVNISLRVNEIESIDNIASIQRQKHRLIVKDNNGNYKILGLLNGLKANVLNHNSGTDLGSFSQATITLTGKEENKSLIIRNLETAGFTIYEKSEFYIGNMQIGTTFTIF